MINVVDEVLASSPRYTIKNNGGTTLYDDVQIDLKTQVTTTGTPLNKALFDSIRDDLNSRLLISSKATTTEAQTGTNDTKYMTPLKTRQALNYLTTTKNISAGTTSETLYTFTNTTAIIRIDGQIGSPAYSGTNYPSITLSGSTIRSYYNNAWSTGNLTITTGNTIGTADSSKCPFWFEFNMTTKSYKGFVFIRTGSGSSGTYSASEIHGTFTSLTSLTISKASTIPLTVTITEIV